MAGARVCNVPELDTCKGHSGQLCVTYISCPRDTWCGLVPCLKHLVGILLARRTCVRWMTAVRSVVAGEHAWTRTPALRSYKSSPWVIAEGDGELHWSVLGRQMEMSK